MSAKSCQTMRCQWLVITSSILKIGKSQIVSRRRGVSQWGWREKYRVKVKNRATTAFAMMVSAVAQKMTAVLPVTALPIAADVEYSAIATMSQVKGRVLGAAARRNQAVNATQPEMTAVRHKIAKYGLFRRSMLNRLADI